jgi:hypothetical protein
LEEVKPMQAVIPSRFNGPDNSGNGGYSAGSLAEFLDGPAEVRLHAPPPLDRPLRVEETDVGLLAFDGDDLVMEAKATGLDVATPPPVSLREAEDATAGFPGWELHGASFCFVCGPDRESPDGLRIFPGPVAGRELVAAPWIPDTSLGDSDGLVSDTVIWAVLDCPGAWAGRAADSEGMPYFPTLGTMTAVIDEPVHVGERHIVMAWHTATERRKLFTEAVLYSEDGSVKGRARHIEIKVPADWANP